MYLSGLQDADFGQLLQCALSALSEPHNYCGFATTLVDEMNKNAADADRSNKADHMFHEEKQLDSFGRSIIIEEVCSKDDHLKRKHTALQANMYHKRSLY